MDGFLSVFRIALTKLKMWIYKPEVFVENVEIRPINLGNEYGGKRFFDFDELSDAVIISCGLGEDASFDVEFASRYGAKVIILDPTPRAICHYKEILDRIGMGAEVRRHALGAHDPKAYDLTKLTSHQLVLEKFALWIRPETLRFFAPKNPKHVSYSITNFQNDYQVDSDFEHIEVDAVSLESLILKYDIHQLHLLKLDIEGAEIEVLKDMLEKRIYPTQIAVEFDGLNFPSTRARLDCISTDSLLRQHGYLCYDFDGVADFLYVLSARVEVELTKKVIN